MFHGKNWSYSAQWPCAQFTGSAHKNLGSLFGFLSPALFQCFLIYETKILFVACGCQCMREPFPLTQISHICILSVPYSLFLPTRTHTHHMFLSCFSMRVSLCDLSVTVFSPPTAHVTLPLATPTVAMATGFTTEQ